jgi:tRNA (cmo5U34)-methyltransferase
MQLENVRQHFEKEAFNYDDLITRLIPKYHEQHNVMLGMMNFERDANLQVLDLGTGTGVLSHIVLRKFPSATVLAFDLAENMLTACQQNLSAYGERIKFVQGNFATDDIGFGYDLIVSGLAIHHLDSEGKQALFRNLFQAMNPGSLLLIREIVNGSTPNLTQKYEQLWREYMRANGEDDSYWFAKYLEEDIPASVEDQTQWLIEAGFEDVGCHWRYLNFAIFGGIKPGIS